MTTQKDFGKEAREAAWRLSSEHFMASNLWKQNRSPKSTLSGTLTSWQKKPEDVQRLQALVSFLRISYLMLIHHDSTYGIAYKFDISFHAKQIKRASHPERQGRVHCQVKGFKYRCQPNYYLELGSSSIESIGQVEVMISNLYRQIQFKWANKTV
ncbi:hypothetical protein NC652_008603 [Populus alba x Populus x berolinensis]|nr:hypothetical protein NC652_008603 [Populus alba x Populus x berolinensis]